MPNEKPSVTRTNHLLPFSELSPAQFERLCSWLAEHEGYVRVQHLGEAGSEQGRDVVAYRAAEGSEQLWYFQCKRYQTISASTLIAEVEKYDEHIAAGTVARPHGIVFVTNAVLSAKARATVEALCQTHGYACEFWAHTELDRKVKQHDRIVAEFFNLAPQPAPQQRQISVSRLPRLLTPDLFGRDKELKLLDEAWADPQTNVVSFVAWGGVGKSALVDHWLQAMERDEWRGAERVFAWSFYSQGTDDKSATAEFFINAALRWFGGDELANKLQTAGQWEKGERLAQLIRQTRTLLILDGLEPVQHPPLDADAPEGGLKEQMMQALLRELAAHQLGLCIISTRFAVADLIGFESRTVRSYALDTLGPQAGAQLLRQLRVSGTQGELEQASEEYGGHSLALTLLSSYLCDVYLGDVHRRHEIESLEEDRKHGRHARKILRAYETWLGAQGKAAMLDVLRMLGLFDRPTDGAAIAALRAAPVIAGLTDSLFQYKRHNRWFGLSSTVTSEPISERDWRQTITALRELRLLAEASPYDPDMLDAHPLVREHFRDQLKSTRPEAWQTGNMRLYEHITRTTAEFPHTIEEMTPLFTAVKHGCAAGRQQQAFDDVYWRRIQRGNEFFSSYYLCAFGAQLATLTEFLDSRRRAPSSALREQSQAIILNEIGSALQTMGQLKTALYPLEESLKTYVSIAEWVSAAWVACNLSNLTLTLGDLSQAIIFAQQGVDLSERGGEWQGQVNSRTALAQAFHCIGNLKEAEANICAAEVLQQQSQPEFPFIYSLGGFVYGDLLITQKRFQEVQLRVTKSLEFTKRYLGPLSVAFEQLVLGRAYLGLAQQQKLPTSAVTIQQLTQAAVWLHCAMDQLQQAGQWQYLPLGLLARAELLRVTGEYERAETDLAEAQRIAERGAMGLHLADCHLEWARLRLAQGDPTRAREAWEQAQAMVARMGYGRRDGEVAELEQQLRAT